jgi:hypothetical protein
MNRTALTTGFVTSSVPFRSRNVGIVAVTSGVLFAVGCGGAQGGHPTAGSSTRPSAIATEACHALELRLTDIDRHGPGDAQPAVARRQLQEAAAASAQAVRKTTREVSGLRGARSVDLRNLAAVAARYERMAARLGRIKGEGFDAIPEGEQLTFAQLQPQTVAQCEHAARYIHDAPTA